MRLLAFACLCDCLRLSAFAPICLRPPLSPPPPSACLSLFLSSDVPSPCCSHGKGKEQYPKKAPEPRSETSTQRTNRLALRGGMYLRRMERPSSKVRNPKLFFRGQVLEQNPSNSTERATLVFPTPSTPTPCTNFPMLDALKLARVGFSQRRAWHFGLANSNRSKVILTILDHLGPATPSGSTAANPYCMFKYLGHVVRSSVAV